MGLTYALWGGGGGVRLGMSREVIDLVGVFLQDRQSAIVSSVLSSAHHQLSQLEQLCIFSLFVSKERFLNCDVEVFHSVPKMVKLVAY